MFKRLFRASSTASAASTASTSASTTTAPTKGKKKNAQKHQPVVKGPTTTPTTTTLFPKQSSSVDPSDVAEAKLKSYRVQVVLKFLKNMNNHDFSLFDNLSLRTRVVFEAFSCNVADYYDVVKMLFKSFPDFQFVVRGIEEEGDKVHVRIQVNGTHTGTPYKATPQTPAIAASGAFVQNDPEIFTCIFGGGTSTRISEIQVHPLGELSGPMGFYTQLLQHQQQLQQNNSNNSNTDRRASTTSVSALHEQ
ncbi:hypothetical protein ACA910_018464 [Epithemia clementina (nom. ined.)]